MLNYNLSDRMAAVARLVPAGVTACDIGCDHGFVAIYLVEEKICPRVIAMDINKGPLLRAREHIAGASLSTYIDTRLSDGLEKLRPGEAECMIAAGMGGRLVVKILSDYPEKTGSLRYLVLQPQSELALVRSCLRRQGFVIRREDMVLEEGKFYPMMLAEAVPREEAAAYVRDGGRADRIGTSGGGRAREGVPERTEYTESLEDEFGPRLIRDRHPVLLQYLDWWEKQQKKILKEVLTYTKRREQVEEELTRIRDVRRWMGENYEML